jgi:glycosyltransferase involved in cell wall biosynthesis
MPQTCLIIPCYNEAKRLDIAAFEKFLSTEKDFAICFVDDGSTDDTVNLLKSLQSRNPGKIFLIKLDQNKGKAEAVRAGVLQMNAKEQFDYFGYFDADLSTSLVTAKDFEQILATYKEVQILFGSRMPQQGALIRKNYLRHLAGRCFSVVINHYFNIDLYDTQCGAKLFRKKIVPLVFEKEFISRWLFDVEIILRLKKKYSGVKTVKEIPLKQWINKKGSKIKLSDLFKLPAEMRKIKATE